MGWESARRRPASDKSGAVVCIPRPSRPPPPPTDYTNEGAGYTAEEIETCQHYHKALLDLAQEDRRFTANFVTYSRKWSIEQQLKWIYAIEQQALDGLDTIGIYVVARVVSNRLD
jgi:hypothetical protein